MYRLVMAIVVGLMLATPAAASAVELEDLRVERKAEPVGIDLERPRFSWVIASNHRGTAQRSYRLRVTAGNRTVWDSGTVRSADSHDVEYGGPQLDAATLYEWRVDVRTDTGDATGRSSFRTGLYDDADWAGSAWIGNARTGGSGLTFAGASWIWTPETAPPVAPPEPRAFRYAFDGGGTAEIIITADDSFRLWLNGRLLGETAGAENEWQQSRRFQVALEPGRNVLAVRTTNGPGSPAGLLVKVRIGDRILTSGTDWKAAKTFPEDFHRPDFDDSAWGAAVVQAAYGSGPWGSNVRAPRDAVRPAPLLRREFQVTGRVRNATLFYAAGGYADFTLNGAPTSADVLTPGFTDYDDTVQYTTADLTSRLTPGTNALGAELGRGFYGMTGGNVWRWESPPWHDEPVVRARLRIEYEDGRVQDVVTDDAWRIADGPTVFDDLYGGETYDARLAIAGWDTPGFQDAGWAAASEVAGPKGVLVNQRQQPIRVTESLPAVEITEPVADTYVVKFPRVLAGWVELAATGPAGTTIRAQYGEKLLANGLPDFSNNGGFQSGFQTDRFILAGTGATERWHAQFSYKGFQYIQVTGWPGDAPPPLSAFTAKAVHTDVEETGSFESSSQLMNKTHRAVVDTMLNNLHGIPTDTPMFEKNGWTGDAALGAEMFLLNFDVHELFAKWLRDVHETREANGRPLVIAPSSGDWGVWGIAPPWHSAYVLIPEWLEQYGGDRRVLAQLYDGMKKYVDLEYDTAGADRIVDNARLGDWVSPEASPAGGNAPEDLRVSATAYLYTMLQSMERSARLLGREADATQFTSRAALVKEAFNARFLDASAGHYRGSGDRGYRQTHNVLAVAFGLTPDAATTQRVVDSIAADVRAKGDTLNTGVLGTKYLLPVLTEHGHADVAYTLATQTKYPSWGFMIENGATSMWEHWALAARSRGHYFLGTVEDWFFHHVAGLRTTDGYRTITIAPKVTGEGLEWARATTRTPYGPVTSDWRKEDGTLSLRVDVPVGSVATIELPADNVHAVTEGGRPVAEADGVVSVRDAGETVRVKVGSGAYAFASDDRMGLAGRALERLDALAAGVRSAPLRRQDERKLTKALDAVAQDVEKALKRLRGGDVDAGAKTLARALGALRDFDAALRAARLDDEDRAALAALAAPVRSALGTAISDYLSVSLTATVEAETVRPGDEPAVRVGFANGGDAEVRDVRAALDSEWPAVPSQLVLAPRLAPGTSASGRFTLTVPETQQPGTVEGEARATYLYEGVSVLVAVPFSVEVVSPITLALATPAAVRPGGTAQVTATVSNAGRAPVTGTLRIAVPDGWTAPAASAPVTIPAGGSADVTVAVAVPRDTPQAVNDVALSARFLRDGTDLASGSTTLRVELAPLGAFHDRVDLGNSASEQAHGLTAAPSSGTSSEAGLTRRYAGHLTPFSWFEFDMKVVPGQPFALRVIETYDRAQTKRYKVYVDGREVHLRQFGRDSGGTLTYEFAVPTASTDDTVRVRFENQDDPSFYDPSIADVWTLPV